MRSLLVTATWVREISVHVVGFTMCATILAVTVYGVAEDLGLVEPPAQAAPQPAPARRLPRTLLRRVVVAPS